MNIRTGRVKSLIEAVLYCLNHNLTGVNPYADLEIGVIEALHSVLHSKRSEAPTYRVIFMRLWRPKKRHNPIALGFVDDPLVTNNGFVHQLKDRLKPLHAKLWVTQTVDQFR